MSFAFWSRLKALVRKETKQLLRDKSSLGIGLVLPVILILLFGYGLSFDLNQARVGVVVDQSSPGQSGLSWLKWIAIFNQSRIS